MHTDAALNQRLNIAQMNRSQRVSIDIAAGLSLGVGTIGAIAELDPAWPPILLRSESFSVRLVRRPGFSQRVTPSLDQAMDGWYRLALRPSRYFGASLPA